MPITINHGDPTSIGQGLNQAAFEQAQAEARAKDEELLFRADQAQLDRDFRGDEAQLGREHQLKLQAEGAEDQFERMQFGKEVDQATRMSKINSEMQAKGWTYSTTVQKQRSDIQRKIDLVKKDTTLQPQNKATAIAGLEADLAALQPDVRPEQNMQPGAKFVDPETGVPMVRDRSGVPKVDEGWKFQQEQIFKTKELELKYQKDQQKQVDDAAKKANDRLTKAKANVQKLKDNFRKTEAKLVLDEAKNKASKSDNKRGSLKVGSGVGDSTLSGVDAAKRIAIDAHKAGIQDAWQEVFDAEAEIEALSAPEQQEEVAAPQPIDRASTAIDDDNVAALVAKVKSGGTLTAKERQAVINYRNSLQ